jgi:hypothetical protein
VVLRVDHVFCFVEPGFPDEEDLRAAGFTVDFGREHAGQGTRNRLVLFDNAYLELIWVSDPAEAERNVLRLDRRASGPCPFGIGLQGRIDDQLRRDMWCYELPGLPAGLWIYEPSNRPDQPLVFVFERDAVSSPRDRGFASELFEHPVGSHRIEQITVAGPELGSLDLAPIKGLMLQQSPAWTMHLRLDGPGCWRSADGRLALL